MTLDFLTLYIVILLNSLTVSVIWAAVAYSYRSFTSARIWLAGCLMTMVGGAVLALHGDGSGPILAAVVGNGLVIYGFCLFWVGIRYFYGYRGGWIASAVITAVSLICLSLVFDNGHGRNLVYATGQSIPLLLGAAILLHPGRRQLGAWIAAIAMIVGVTGHIMESIYNIALMTGAIERQAYLIIESTVLLCVIFSGVLWNFGFAVMTIDRLRNEVAALAVEDELTGLPNRRRLLERIAEEEARSLRTGRPFALLMLDLDHFKTLNDTLGHSAGDAALRHLAVTVTGQTRKNDLVARFGGDEFCIVLPETSAAQAGVLASNIAHAVRQTRLRWQSQDIAITASIGAAAWQNGFAEGETLERADRALYVAKAHGRDGFSLDGIMPELPPRKAPSVVAVLPAVSPMLEAEAG
jgi:diguanylate cyclase (GGDEF)-like protein